MIDTDLKYLEKDLKEELEFFDRGNELKIRHLFSEKEDRVVNTIVVDGKAYAYGNLLKKTDNELENKRLIKRFAKLSLYKAVSAYTGQVLPWGALTGIRPTKLAYSEIEKTGEFEDFFSSVMKVSDEKISLTKKVINSQKGIYQKKDGNTDFFVFVPFCPSRCKYCSFVSQDVFGAVDLIDEYVNVLSDEIKFSKKFIKNLRSIYVGGGTPVVLSENNLDKLLTALDEINKGVEFTVEAGRPDCITKEKIEILKRHNVTRVCVNPQTFSDETLERIGRKHTVKDVLSAYELVKNDFIVNMDVIAGLEQESFETFKAGIDKAIELSPDNLTVHSLCVKRGSYLKNETDKVNSKEIEKMIDYAERTIMDAGYNPYYVYRQKYMAGNLENVGFCKKGKECVFNIDSMEETTDCVACGANGISKRVDNENEKIERFANPKDIKTYFEKQKTIKEEKEKLFNN